MWTFFDPNQEVQLKSGQGSLSLKASNSCLNLKRQCGTM